MQGFKVTSLVGEHVLRDGVGLHMPVRTVNDLGTEFVNRPPNLSQTRYEVEAIPKVSAETEASIKRAVEDMETANMLREHGGDAFRVQSIKTILNYVRGNRAKAKAQAKAAADFNPPELASLGKSTTIEDKPKVSVGDKK